MTRVNLVDLEMLKLMKKAGLSKDEMKEAKGKKVILKDWRKK